MACIVIAIKMRTFLWVDVKEEEEVKDEKVSSSSQKACV